MTPLTDAEVERYSRQLVLEEWSAEAQEALMSATAIVVGAGALGSPAAAYLAAAGVGRIGIVDSDPVELSNLQRQPLHYTPDIGTNKAESAAAKLGVLNPGVTAEPYPVRLDAANAEAIVSGADVVVDCTDTFATRYVVNDACCAAGVQLVEAGVLGFEGLVMAIRPGESACYRCVFPDPPPPEAVRACRDYGVLGPVAGMIGSLQALEALKLLTGVGEPLLDRFLQFDGRTVSHVVVATSRRLDCGACGSSESSP